MNYLQKIRNNCGKLKRRVGNILHIFGGSKTGDLKDNSYLFEFAGNTTNHLNACRLIRENPNQREGKDLENLRGTSSIYNNEIP